MSGTIAARGSQSLTSYHIGQRSDNYQSGHPIPTIKITAAPASAPTFTLTTGTASMTGVFLYKTTFVTKTGETTASAASLSATPVSQNVVVTAAGGAPADTEVTKIRIYRSDNGGTYHLVHEIKDPSGSLAWTDTFVADDPLIDTTAVIPAFNQSGANGGEIFLEPETFSGDVDPSSIIINQLTGTALAPAAYPGPVKFPCDVKNPLDSGSQVPLLASIIGEPVVTMQSDGVFSCLYDLTASIRKPRDLNFTHYPGGTKRPFQIFNVSGSELSWKVKGGGVAESQYKGMGTGFNLCGVGAWTSTPNVDYPHCPVIRNIRTDATAITDPMFLKVTAIGSGYIDVKAKVTAAASYGSIATRIYYDTTTKKQKRAGAQVSDWAILVDSTTGDELGQDVWESRMPLLVMFPGDMSAIDANDEFRFEADTKAYIPGAGTTPGTNDGEFTGFAPRTYKVPRFSAAHVSFLRGAVTATEAMNFEEGEFSIAWPIDPSEDCGYETMNPTDFTRNGFVKFTAKLKRRAIDQEFLRSILAGGRYAGIFKFQGEKIMVQPGTRSTTYRELIQVTTGILRVDDVKSPTTGPNTTKEDITFVAEQPASYDTEGLSVLIQTRVHPIFR